jgi:phage shock protein C
MENKQKKRLYRLDGGDAKLFGVCGGIAEYFDVDPTIIRVIWAILIFAYGTGLLAYLVCALCMPKKSEIK